jgi:hypothetical protein
LEVDSGSCVVLLYYEVIVLPRPNLSMSTGNQSNGILTFINKHKALIATGILAPIATGIIVGIVQTFLQPVILESSGVVKPDDKKAVIDCTRELNNKGFPELESLCSPLKNNFLRKADHETYQAIGRMIPIADRKNKKKSEYYSGADIANKKICPQLIEIDRLWKEASSNRLGFSIQKKIWIESDRNYQVFTEKIGWGDTTNGWKDKLSYQLNDKMPDGHLPALWNQKQGDSVMGDSSSEEEYMAFFKTIEACKIQ